MTDQEIIAKTNKALAEEFELDMSLEDMTSDVTLADDLGLDSLDSVDMVVLFEQEFGVKIGKDPAIVQIKTLGDLHAYIIGKVRSLESGQA